MGHGKATDPVETDLQDVEGAPVEANSVERLYREHAGWLHGRLRGLLKTGSDAHLVDDLVHETYLRAAAVQARRLIEQPRPLLLRIAGRLVIDRARRRRLEPVAHPDPGLEQPVPPDQEAQLQLKQALLALPPRQREVILLVRFSGLTNAEVALELGVSIKTVEARMTRALALLTAALRD